MNIENKIRELLEAVDEKTPAQMSYPGATGPQDPAPYMGVNFEELELDRPGVVAAEIAQVQYPGQTMPDPEPLGPEYQELDPYNMSQTIQEVPKENYPIGSGADDVQAPQDPSASMQPDQYSAGINPAQHPAPFVAEETEIGDQDNEQSQQYQSYKPAKVSAKSQGQHIVVLDKNTAATIEKKLGLPKGSLAPVQGSRYSETVVVKGKDNKLHTVYAKDDVVRARSYGHNDQESTQALADHLNEALDVGQQQVDPVDQQNAILQQAVQAVEAGNKIEDVAKATGLDIQAIQDAVEAAQPTASPAAPQTTAPVSESSLKQDVESILGEETLSEEFKSKAAALFESTVVSRVNEEVKRLEEAYDEKLSTEIKSLQEQYVEAIETYAEKQSTRLNNYINYLGEQWIKQNRVALHQGIRTDLTEGFMKGLQKLFTEHYINVPTEKIDVVAEQKTEIEKLHESIAEMTSKIEVLEESNHNLKREAVISRVSEGLTDTEVAKLHTLCEGVSFESEEIFESKINMIRNNFFTRKPVQSPEQLLESTIHASQPHAEEKKQIASSPNMERYIAALNKFKG